MLTRDLFAVANLLLTDGHNYIAEVWSSTTDDIRRSLGYTNHVHLCLFLCLSVSSNRLTVSLIDNLLASRDVILTLRNSACT